MTLSSLQSTAWLAKRLRLSVTTIEQLRAQGSQDLPTCRTMGTSKGYDKHVVEQ